MGVSCLYSDVLLMSDLNNEQSNRITSSDTSMSTPGNTPDGDKVNVDSGVFVAVLVTIALALVFIPFVWIFIHYVLKDRETARKRLKVKNETTVELGGKTERASNEIGVSGVHELEQPEPPELDSRDVKEMWDEGCAKEKDGQPQVLEMDAGSITESKASSGSAKA